MKRLLGIIFSLIMISSIMGGTVYADDISDEELSKHKICKIESFDDFELLTETEFKTQYLKNPIIQIYYKNSPEEVLAMADVAYEDYRQLGGTSSISGSTVSSKLTTLGTQMNTSSSSGTTAGRMCTVLNSYAPSDPYKSYAYSSISSESNFRIYCFSSLADNRAPILQARTEDISYYNGHPSGHYIEMYGIYYNNMTCRLNDTNNNSSYYGYHSVSISDAFAGISTSGVLIYWW